MTRGEHSVPTVLVINHANGPHLGGAELSLLSILDTWRSAHAVDLIVASPLPTGSMTRALQDRGHRNIELAMPQWIVGDGAGGWARRKAILHVGLHAIRELRGVIRTEQVSLVVTNTIVQPWGALAAAAEGVPHVWMIREFGDHDQGFSYPFGRTRTRREIGILSSIAVVNSHAVAADYGGVFESPPIVSYPPVDLRLVAAMADPPGVETEERTVRAVVPARLSREKGQWRVIEALAELGRDHSDAHALRVDFIGGASDKSTLAQLRSLARARGVLHQVRFLGEHQNPYRLMKRADFAVVPSGREAFGRATLEALSLGLPVITTRTGAGAELVDASCGLLFEPDDISGLAAAMLTYLQDPRLRLAHSRCAIERAESISSNGDVSEGLAARLTDAIALDPAQLPQEWKTMLTAHAGGPTVPLHLQILARLEMNARKGLRGLLNPRRTFSRLLGHAFSRAGYDNPVVVQAER